MKAVNLLVLGLGLLLLLAAGSACLSVALDPAMLGRFHSLTADVEGSLASASGFRPLLGAAGGLLLLAAVAVVWANLSQRRFERIVVLRNPLGEVLVSLTALEDLGRLVKAEVPGVKDLKLRIRAGRRGIRADARVVLQGDVDVAQVSEAVQAGLRRRLQQVLGPDQDVRPRVMVSKLLPAAAEPDELLPGRVRLRRPPRP
jgi:hypothetical protein